MPVCGNYLFFELPKKIVLNPKDGPSMLVPAILCLQASLPGRALFALCVSPCAGHCRSSRVRLCTGYLYILADLDFFLK